MRMHPKQLEAYQLAMSFKGLREIPGGEHNPEIVQMFADTGHAWVKDDETAWCAAFVGAMLARVGLEHTGSLAARDYLGWGKPVDLSDAQPGDVVVFWRESPESWKGHVAFFHSMASARAIFVLGGNQGNEVSVDTYTRNRLLGVRRMPAPIIDAPILDQALEPKPKRKLFFGNK